MAISVTKNQPRSSRRWRASGSRSRARLCSCRLGERVRADDQGDQIPCLLSLLSYGNIHDTVPGLRQFPSDDWAPVNLTFQAYHVMIDLGFLFPLIGVVGWLYWRRRRERHLRGSCSGCSCHRLPDGDRATIAGWWTAEIGRQPWIVWNVLRTSDAVSPTLRTDQVLAVSRDVRAALPVADCVVRLLLLDRKIKRGPETVDADARRAAAARTRCGRCSAASHGSTPRR